LTDVVQAGQPTGCPETVIIVGTTHVWGDAAVTWPTGAEEVALGRGRTLAAHYCSTTLYHVR
jgi:hypothetical protein